MENKQIKIIVTENTGYIKTHLSSTSLSEGYEVIGLDNKDVDMFFNQVKSISPAPSF